MPDYQITAEGLEVFRVTCPGCTGDALTLALGDRGMQSFKVQRRSVEGRQWWFQVTFKPEMPGASEDNSVTKVVSVYRIDD